MSSLFDSDSPSGKVGGLNRPPFSCDCKQNGSGSMRLHLAGELDLATSPQFERILEEAQKGATALSIDLEELTFIDGTGLGVIANASHRAARTGSRLTLVNCSGQVRRILELTGVPDHVGLHPVEASAPASSDGRPSAAASAG